MNLTARQEQMVSRFLRDIDAGVKAQNPVARARTRGTIRKKLTHELARLGTGIPSDVQVQAILDRCRNDDTQDDRASSTPAQTRTAREIPQNPKPEVAAKTTTKPRVHTEPEDGSDPDRVWLGVCCAWSRRTGFPLSTCRAVATIGGVLTGPLALLAYLGLYAELRARGEDRYHVPVPEASVVVAGVFGTAVQMLVLLAAGWAIPWLIFALAARLAPHLTNTLYPWAWFTGVRVPAFSLILVLALPLSVLAALPLNDHWGRWLDHLKVCFVGLYAAVVCFGIATAVAGSLIATLRYFGG